MREILSAMGFCEKCHKKMLKVVEGPLDMSRVCLCASSVDRGQIISSDAASRLVSHFSGMGVVNRGVKRREMRYITRHDDESAQAQA